MKKLLRFSCFSLLFLALACAPKPKTPGMPIYEAEFSLEEVISRAGNDVDILKAIADIRINKDNEPFDFVSASVLVRRPGWVHMRVYRFGMLLRDIVMKNDALYVLSGKSTKNLRRLMEELYSAVFWWDELKDATMDVRSDSYVIQTPGKVLLIDRYTLLPMQQRIHEVEGDILIKYDEPDMNDGFRYQSKIRIYAGDFTFNVNVKKMIKNPVPGEMDFQTQPAG